VRLVADAGEEVAVRVAFFDLERGAFAGAYNPGRLTKHAIQPGVWLDGVRMPG
jgi:hypothetical protein